MAAFVLLNAPSGAPSSSCLALNAELLADNGAPYFIAGPNGSAGWMGSQFFNEVAEVLQRIAVGPEFLS